MLSTFDKEKYKQLTKQYTQSEITDKLTNIYGIKTSVNAVKNWTRSATNQLGKVYQPELEVLKALADICNCSIQDFFSDADIKREQIAQQEISNKPDTYSKSLLSTFPDDLKDLFNYYQMLDEEDRVKYLQEIKQKAMSKLHGN